MNLNQATIVGHLTRDPELRSLPSGENVASFSVATNRTYKDRDGNSVDTTEFHNIVVFGKQAELSAQYLRKGSEALISGRLQTRSWDKDGVKQYRTEIVAETVQFGSRPSGVEGPAAAQAPETPSYPDEEIDEDDVPF